MPRKVESKALPKKIDRIVPVTFAAVVRMKKKVSYSTAYHRVSKGGKWKAADATSVLPNQKPGMSFEPDSKIPDTTLTVVERMPNSVRRESRYKMLCECGAVKVVYKKNVMAGRTKSCGAKGCRIEGEAGGTKKLKKSKPSAKADTKPKAKPKATKSAKGKKCSTGSGRTAKVTAKTNRRKNVDT